MVGLIRIHSVISLFVQLSSFLSCNAQLLITFIFFSGQDSVEYVSVFQRSFPTRERLDKKFEGKMSFQTANDKDRSVACISI